MMKPILIAVIVVLLSAAVGYLALERQEKNVAEQKAKSFDDKFAK